MKYFRLGMSESSLLFMYYIEKHNVGYDEIILKYYRNNLLNWLYSTSGFFDITIKGNYFNFSSEYYNIIHSTTYNIYFENLLNYIKNTEFTSFYFKCHNLTKIIHYLPDFFKYINKENLTQNENNTYIIKNIIEDNLNNKRVLLIHNLSELMIKQYYDGNIKKINSSFPNFKYIIPYKIGYTFLNNYLHIDFHKNIIERVKSLCVELRICIYYNKIDFVIISCGAYSSLLAQELVESIDYCLIGREIEKEFGIITNSNKALIEDTKYYVTVPDELKPPGHEIIENSCYW
jgi:hypothetical protein